MLETVSALIPSVLDAFDERLNITPKDAFVSSKIDKTFKN
jgi:hypothetical protein